MTTATAAPPPIVVQPGALLVTAAAAVTAVELNAALQPYGLGLPIDPLTPGLTLADLAARNAGGRRRLRYGTLARYLRAATVEGGDAAPGALLTLGGPTLKRATGYGLNRALAGGWRLTGTLRDLTLSLRPLPPARQALLFVCRDLPAACRLAATLLAEGLALSALAVADDHWTMASAVLTTPPPDGWVALLLAELEGTEAVVDRQAERLRALARQAGACPLAPHPDPWSGWERHAAQHGVVCPLLDISLSRAVLPDFITQARAIAGRYRLELLIWGDAGVGALHLSFAGGQASEAQQVAALVYDLARRMGGALATEMGGGDLSARLWTYEARRRGVERVAAAASVPPGGSAPDARFAERLRAIVGADYVLTRPAELATYRRDASIAEAAGQPLAVALPASTAEVSAVLRLAAAAGVPVVTRGAGSGLAGGSTPTPGALVLALTRMERLRLNAAQMTAHAEAGVVTADLQRAAEAHGLFYPPDPSSQGVSTIGGNIACNAGGPRCLKYGVTADYVLGLTAVLADGSLLCVGDGLTGQTPDAGLLHLLIGSEGTLAVITEATLRLIPLPAARRTTLAVFDRLDDACATVETIMAAGLTPAGLELMDDTTIAVVDDYLGLGLPRDAGALLLLLADGEPEAVSQEAAALGELARHGGARTVQVAHSAADEAALWRARRAIAPALARVRPNRLGEDIAVPLNRIADCVRRIKAIAAAYDLPIVVFGHAGDGNLHPNILFDSRDPQEVARVWQAAEAIFAAALELGGVLSGEHGIGTLKRPFMQAALGAEALALQRAIKARFDPAGRLNPGKVLP